MPLQAEMLAEILRRDGAAIERVDANPFGRREPRVLRFIYVLRRLCRLRRCDLAVIFAGSNASFFAFTAVPLVAARLYGVPSVIMYKGGLSRPFFKRWAWLVRPFVRMARKVVVPGRFLQNVFARYGMEAAVIPDIIKADPAQLQPRPPAGPPFIFNPRRHDLVCGVDVALSAFVRVTQEFPDAELHLCGDGPLRPRFERMAAALARDRVKFYGFISHDDMKDFYRRASLLVNANRDDNHPNSILEAMAFGVPVVATAVGGVPFLIRDGETGFLVPPEDPAALAEKIVYVLRHPAEAAEVAARARRAVAELMWPFGRAGHLQRLLDFTRGGDAAE